MSRDALRDRFPVAARFVDRARAVFGPDVTVTYARQGKDEVGQREDGVPVNARPWIDPPRRLTNSRGGFTDLGGKRNA